MSRRPGINSAERWLPRRFRACRFLPNARDNANRKLAVFFTAIPFSTLAEPHRMAQAKPKLAETTPREEGASRRLFPTVGSCHPSSRYARSGRRSLSDRRSGTSTVGYILPPRRGWFCAKKEHRKALCADPLVGAKARDLQTSFVAGAVPDEILGGIFRCAQNEGAGKGLLEERCCCVTAEFAHEERSVDLHRLLRMATNRRLHRAVWR